MEARINSLPFYQNNDSKVTINCEGGCWHSKFITLIHLYNNIHATVAVNKKFTYVVRTASGPYCGRTLCVLLLRTNRLAPRGQYADCAYGRC